MADTCATKAGEPGWQAAFGCREDQLHEEVRKGRLTARVCDSNCTGEEPANSQFGGSKSMIGMDPLRKLDSKSLAMHPDGTFRT